MFLMIETYKSAKLELGKIQLQDATLEEIRTILGDLGVTGQVLVNTPDGVTKGTVEAQAPLKLVTPEPTPPKAPKAAKPSKEPAVERAPEQPKEAAPATPTPVTRAKIDAPAEPPKAEAPANGASGSNGHAAAPAPAPKPEGGGLYELSVINEKKRARDIVVYLIGCGIKDPDKLVAECKKLSPEVPVLARVPDLEQRVRDLAAAVEA